MLKKILLSVLIVSFFVVFEILILNFLKTRSASKESSARFWDVQSIDTMKYSRDASSSDLSLDFIDNQVQLIAETGATHVSIATPYDTQFIPRLTEWVQAARKYNLKVWFRGNFSGWEGWFGYKKDLTREQHFKLTQDFILNNQDLFVDGDIFTACPECENGGLGDPRLTGDTEGFRKFMIDEYNMTQSVFGSINKRVTTNYDSMNGDVANLIMDPATTASMGGIVAIDDYVSTPSKLQADIDSIALKSGGKVVLGEYGTPIPDINGDQTPKQQADWLRDAYTRLVDDKNVVGLNYWVSFGGTTKLWEDDGTARQAALVLKSFYSPNVFHGIAVDANGNVVPNAYVNYLHNLTSTDNDGNFYIPYDDSDMSFSVSYKFDTEDATVGNAIKNNGVVVLSQVDQSFFQVLTRFLNK